MVGFYDRMMWNVRLNHLSQRDTFNVILISMKQKARTADDPNRCSTLFSLVD